MLEVNVTNEMTTANVSATCDSCTLSGDFRVNPVTGKVSAMNLSVYGKGTGEVIGNINAYSANDNGLSYNFNSMDVDNIASVASAVKELVGNLEEKYNPVNSEEA